LEKLYCAHHPKKAHSNAFRVGYLEGAKGYYISLGFWWHISFPDKVIQCMLIHKKDNSDNKLISINKLKYVTGFKNYCSLLHIITMSKITENLHPVLLNVTNNASALNCMNYTCRKFRIGTLLSQFFSSLLINSLLGNNSH
jgi:hypothetical protein